MKEYIYISIPRTGTNSIHKLLGQIDSENHKSIELIERAGYSFAFVRNPYDLLVSWFYYHKQHQPKLEVYHCEFLTWIDRGCPHHWSDGLLKSSGVTHPLNQFQYICDSSGMILVNMIGRFESLQEDFINICDVIGIKDKSLPHVNGSKHNPWEGYYTPKALAQVKDQFKKDFEIFNY